MVGTLPIDVDIVNFNVEAFDEFIKNNGVRMHHFKAIRCPVGMIDPSDSTRRVGHNHANCSNGFIYKFAGEVHAHFSNNSAIVSLSDVGVLDGATSLVTFPRFYSDSGKQIYLQSYDRFYIKDLAVLTSNTETVENSITGPVKFTYQAEEIEYIIDENNTEYTEQDFEVRDGKLVWKSENRPGYDASLSRNINLAVRYLYTPFFYVTKLIHEVRLAYKSDFITGERIAVRMPYQALISREYFMYKEERGDGEQENRREMEAPSTTSLFGSR